MPELFHCAPMRLLAAFLCVASLATTHQLYRLAGMPAPLTEHVRTWVDGQPLGYQLLIEQPNKAFLRRNKRDDSGYLYKVLWYEQGLVRQHEKKLGQRLDRRIWSTSTRA